MITTMTRKRCKKLIEELIEKTAEDMKQKVDRVFMSGAVNLDSFEEDYRLPKIILYALLQDECYRWKPARRKDVAYANNINQCI